MTTQANARPAANGTGGEQVGQTTNIVAPASVLPPAGRRRLAVAIVPACPYCRRPHLHRGLRLDGATRTAGCGQRAYILAVSA